MKPLIQLLIRACKSKQPEVRLYSVYRRFYGKYDKQIYDENITYILMKIIEEFNIMSITDLAIKLHPDQRWRFLGPTDNFNNYAVLLRKVIISAIRITEIAKFNGLISPIRFRRGSND